MSVASWSEGACWLPLALPLLLLNASVYRDWVRSINYFERPCVCEGWLCGKKVVNSTDFVIVEVGCMEESPGIFLRGGKRTSLTLFSLP